MPVTFRLYSRAGCHLCEEMLKELGSLQRASAAKFTVEVADIDRDPELRRRYSLRIPVLIDPASGTVLCETRFDQQSVLGYLTTTK